MAAERALELFRARWKDIMNGAGGSPTARGIGILQARSKGQQVAELLAWATDSVNGSGEVPGSDALRSCAGSMGVGADVITSTVLSLLCLLDELFLMNSGDHTTASRIFEIFGESAERPITAESTHLKTPTIPESTPSPVQGQPSVSGPEDKHGPISVSSGEMVNENASSTRPKRSYSRKPSAKKRRKSRRR